MAITPRMGLCPYTSPMAKRRRGAAVIVVLSAACLCAPCAQGQTATETVLLSFGIFPGGI